MRQTQRSPERGHSAPVVKDPVQELCLQERKAPMLGETCDLRPAPGPRDGGGTSRFWGHSSGSNPTSTTYKHKTMSGSPHSKPLFLPVFLPPFHPSLRLETCQMPIPDLGPEDTGVRRRTQPALGMETPCLPVPLIHVSPLQTAASPRLPPGRTAPLRPLASQSSAGHRGGGGGGGVWG